MLQINRRSHFNPAGVFSTSSLHAPIVRIENHRSEVLSCEFHSSGKYVVSSNSMGEVQICDIYGTFKKLVLKGHTGAVLETNFSGDGFEVYSCSSDGSIIVWDAFDGYRKNTFEGHKSAINSVRGTNTGYRILCSGSNDGTVKMWDTCQQKCTLTLKSDADVNAVCFNMSGNYIFSGGIDKDIKIWDIRRKDMLYKLSGHTDRVTGLALSPCGNYLLSHSADSSLRVWDVRPYISNERGIRCYPSNTNVESLLRCSWSQDGSMISAGTAEREVYVWDANTGGVLHKLSGHENNINDVAFHPKENIVLSASNDNYLFMREI